jgi:hypothetical protein
MRNTFSRLASCVGLALSAFGLTAIIVGLGFLVAEPFNGILLGATWRDILAIPQFAGLYIGFAGGFFLLFAGDIMPRDAQAYGARFRAIPLGR